VNWFAWRQHRLQFLILGLFLAAFAALLIPTGIHFWNSYVQAKASCAANPSTPSCADLSETLFQSSTDQALFELVPITLLLLPAILGMFWGAPLLAREYGGGTNNLVWTQGISRRKWLTVKLIWILLSATLFLAAFAGLVTWWSAAPNALKLNRFAPILFSTQNIVPVAYGLFAIAAGILFGAWFRKTMIAAVLVLVLYIGLAVIAIPTFLRPHYQAPINVTTEALSSKIPAGARVVSRGIVGGGHTYDRLDFVNMPPQCQQLVQQAQSIGQGGAKADPGNAIDNCLNSAGYRQFAQYQPASRYWLFQWIESAIFLSLAALAIGATYWLVLKRDA
jgi:ABC-type transport system involved in multi-copper enzyme maturation permease subunit